MLLYKSVLIIINSWEVGKVKKRQEEWRPLSDGMHYFIYLIKEFKFFKIIIHFNSFYSLLDTSLIFQD